MLTTSPTASCVHHWMIQDADAAADELLGSCKRCAAERCWPRNPLGDGDFNEQNKRKHANMMGSAGRYWYGEDDDTEED